MNKNYSPNVLQNFVSQKHNSNKFKFITWNVRSIKSLNSFQKFKTEIAEYVSLNIDLIILTETWTNDYSKFDLYKLKNYNKFSCSRKDSTGGGVMIYVHNKHTAKLVSTHNCEYIEFVSVSLELNDKEFIIHSIYRPPNSHFESFLKKLESLMTLESPIIITGDFNINKFKIDNMRSQFLDLLNSFGACITNHAITRNFSKTLIDYVITQNLPKNISINTFTSSELLSSDHNMLLSLLNVYLPKKVENKIIRKLWDYEKLRNSFVYDNRLLNDSSATESCTYIINCILNAMNESSSTVEFKSKNNMYPPWADIKYHKLINTSVNILNKIAKLEKKGKPTSKLRKKLNSIKTSIDEHSDKVSKQYYSTLIKTNSRHTWDVINNILGKKKEMKKIVLKQNGNMIYNSEQISEILNEKFSTVSCKIPDESFNDKEFIYNGRTVYDCIQLLEASPEEIFNIICELDSKKAAGSDGIPCKVIKELKEQLANPLTCIVNKIISEAQYPDILKLATVVPIYKKGDSHDPKNYRPISLLPIINKIFEN